MAFYRGQKGLSLKNPEKNPKRGSRGLPAPGLKKLEKESKTSQKPEKNLKKKENFRLFFELFRPCGWEASGTPFRTFFRAFQGEVFLPKGPFRTKSSTAPESVVFCYRRSFLLSVPFSCLFFLEKQALLSTIRSVLLLP